MVIHLTCAAAALLQIRERLLVREGNYLNVFLMSTFLCPFMYYVSV